jgi:copper(I)-binding protein
MASVLEMTGRFFRRTGVHTAAAAMMITAFLAACQHAPPQISIENAEVQLSPAVYGEAMVFMTIKNDGGPDVLKDVSIDVPGAIAMFHVMEGERMAQEDSVEVPGGTSVVFKLGSSHIMIRDMPRTMMEGSPITLTLVFEKSGTRLLHLKLAKAPPLKPMPSM